MILESEDLMLRSPTIRRDLRHLIAHGHCRFELTRQLHDAFQDAYSRAPVNSFEVVRWLDDTTEGRAHLQKMKIASLVQPLKAVDHRKRLTKERTMITKTRG